MEIRTKQEMKEAKANFKKMQRTEGYLCNNRKDLIRGVCYQSSLVTNQTINYPYWICVEIKRESFPSDSYGRDGYKKILVAIDRETNLPTTVIRIKHFGFGRGLQVFKPKLK